MIELCKISATANESQAMSDAFEGSRGQEPVMLIDLLTQFARRKRLIGEITGAFLLIGVLLCVALPLRYTAAAKLMPPQQTGSATTFLVSQMTGSGASSLTALAGGGLTMKNPNDLYIGLLESRPIADRIVRRFGLSTIYRTKSVLAAREQLARNTKITSEKSGLISISVTDGDKNRAADIANTYADELRVLTKNLAVTEAARRRSFFEEQLKQTKNALDEAEGHFQQVQQKSGMVSLDAQSAVMIESVASLHAQVAAKQVEIGAMRTYSTDNNPEVQLAESQLQSLKTEAARAEQRGDAPGRSELHLADVPEASVEYLRAQHEVQYQRTLFDLLLKQYDAARLDEGKEAAIIQVAEPAIPPEKKSSPQRALILGLFTIFGVFSGCMVVHLSALKQRALRDPESAARLAALKRAWLTGR